MLYAYEFTIAAADTPLHPSPSTAYTAYYTVLNTYTALLLILYCPVYPLSILGLFAVGADGREMKPNQHMTGWRSCTVHVGGTLKRRTHTLNSSDQSYPTGCFHYKP
jgi:hypothetical protein